MEGWSPAASLLLLEYSMMSKNSFQQHVYKARMATVLKCGNIYLHPNYFIIQNAYFPNSENSQGSFEAGLVLKYLSETIHVLPTLGSLPMNLSFCLWNSRLLSLCRSSALALSALSCRVISRYTGHSRRAEDDSTFLMASSSWCAGALPSNSIDKQSYQKVKTSIRLEGNI